MLNHISENPTFALVALLTAFAWVAVAYCIYLVWNTKKPRPNPIIGYVESMTESPQGLSVQFKINDSEAGANGIRLIKNASIHSVSIVDEVTPGWQGRITHVDGVPEELCKHGYPTDELHNAEGRCSRNPGRFL